MADSPKWQWDVYYKVVPNDKPKDTLDRALAFFGAENVIASQMTAIDLGCGNGPDTKELLKRGWKVAAIDYQKEALEIIKSSILPEQAGRLHLCESEFQNIKLIKSNLINASFSLPFCRPEHFQDLWNKIEESIVKGGRFAGHFFGVNDSWFIYDNMTFHTRNDIERMFRNFETEYFLETEEDGYQAGGVPKHWHVYHIVARKN